jgi:hypothetical protein
MFRRMVMLCRYKREGKIGGHWCNECPPPAEYAKIERKEHEAFLKANRERSKRGNSKVS